MGEVVNRRSIRLDGFDYALEGAYFITVCVEHKEHRFGHITDGVMHLNDAGQMISERIEAIPAKFPGTLVDSYVVMPNHIHFILTLVGFQPNGGYVGATHRGRPLSDRQGRESADEKTGVENMNTVAATGADDVLDTSGPNGPKAGGHDRFGEGTPLHVNDPAIDSVPSVADVVGWFKASTTNYYIKDVKEGRYPAFDRRLWQRNYYEHIIRTEAAYNQIDAYIRTNPLRWAEDRLR
ncbi:transposase [Fibrella arboris]|uniref:transposase n=1 Tax=Fibrella arboris TaxID=3242486 RepID=UPI00351F8875